MMKQFLSVSGDIIHNSVHDNVGERIGKISDVLIDPETNIPRVAILSEGGILGLGSDHYALPFHLLRFNTNSSDVALKVESSHIKNAPEIDLDKLKRNDRKEIDKLVNFYGENAFRNTEAVDSNSYVGEPHTNHHHQGYEGSAKITGEGPKTKPADDMDYDQLKRGKEK